jgi:hypothetical protein
LIYYDCSKREREARKRMRRHIFTLTFNRIHLLTCTLTPRTRRRVAKKKRSAAAVPSAVVVTRRRMLTKAW